MIYESVNFTTVFQPGDTSAVAELRILILDDSYWMTHWEWKELKTSQLLYQYSQVYQ